MSVPEITPATNPSAVPARIQPKTASPGAIALDQWRGLAMVLVLISHGFFFTHRVDGIGRVGVNLFFFISGVLVYRSLDKGREKGWKLARSFWWRRLRRLYPALIAYALTMAVAVFFLQNLPHLPPKSDFKNYLGVLPLALTYSINYQSGSPLAPDSIALGHLWSVSCEMQFYMLGPLIFIAGGSKPRQQVLFFGGLLLALVLLGMAYPILFPGYDQSKYHFEFAVWPMMLGFFCEYSKARFLKIPPRVVRLTFALGVAALILSLVLMVIGTSMKKMVIGAGALAVLPCFLAYLFGRPFPGKSGRFLGFVGERTYSIYLWQQPLTICDYLPYAFQPFGSLASILVGAGWFHVFEKPFLSAGRSKTLLSFRPPAG
jgi:peptidoglycan/LPS O-acetylase OafA/YrhL